jgi:predicted N-acetyltransferase YhbS
MGFEILPCTKDQDDLFHHVANTSFGKPSNNWFRDHGGHIYLSKEDPDYAKSLENNYIAWMDREPVGTIGIYPIRVVAGERQLWVAGIGTVGVLPAHRGVGVMSAMLQEILSILDQSDYDLSWLWGERIRYKNYGYDLGGKTLQISLDQKTFRAFQPLPRQIVTNPGKEDIERMDEFYKRYSYRVVRNHKQWERHLKRVNLTWKVSEDGSYAVFRGENPRVICEVAGTFQGIVSILSEHVKKHNLTQLAISASFERHGLLENLIEYCCDYTVTSCNQLRLLPFGRSRHHLTDASIRFCGELFDSKIHEAISLYINEIDKV